MHSQSLPLTSITETAQGTTDQGVTDQERAAIEAAVATLPGPYRVEWEDVAAGVPVAFVVDPKAIRARPMFMLSRLRERTLFHVMWMDGSHFHTWAFPDFEQPLHLMASAVFEAGCCTAGVESGQGGKAALAALIGRGIH